MAIPKITKEFIDQALKFIDENGVGTGHDIEKYALVVGNKKYPPKYVIAVARHLRDNVEIHTDDYNGQGAAKYLKGMGYTINEKGEEKMEDFKQFLLNNHNIILHGAPGTGKTYLAKDIAIDLIFEDEDDRTLIRRKEEELQTNDEKKKYIMLNAMLNAQYCFVQFHQSYDYTDFVEGLRPKDDGKGNIGFARKDGVFKEFCKRPLLFNAFCRIFDDKCEEIEKNNNENKKIKLKTAKKGNQFEILWNSKSRNCFKLYTGDNSEYRGELTKYSMASKYSGIKSSDIRGWEPYYEGIVKEWGIDEKIKNMTLSIDPDQMFIFVIDEINRGEMSKIFGELFFSIDPGYRGTEGRIKTQYQNLINDDNDVFVDGFFVPENVYVIGTMNDIDRSVESMDFAMRRRFAFKEIKAKDSQKMFGDGTQWENGTGKKVDVSKEVLDDIIKRMDNLNNAILKKDLNLGSSYQIGGAYFKKYANYTNEPNPFKCLWDNHIECVLREYLRGMDPENDKLRTLARAYGFSEEEILKMYPKNEENA